MAKKGASLRSLGGIYVKAIFGKLIELFTPFGGIFEALDRFIFELPHSYQGFEIRVRHYTLC